MIRKRLLALSLVLTLLVSTAACGNGSDSGGSGEKIEGEDAVVWGESATAKIVGRTAIWMWKVRCLH